MTKKHFIAIAKLINKVGKTAHNPEKPYVSPLKTVAEGLADICQEQNPQFDRQKFLSACGF